MSATAVSPFNGRSGNRTPDRSLQQRREGLRLANAVRTARAQLKRDLQAGIQSIYPVLLEPPDYLLTARVFDLLLAVPKYGRVKVNKILAQVRISPNKTIGGLSPRQRQELVGLLSRGALRSLVQRVESTGLDPKEEEDG